MTQVKSAQRAGKKVASTSRATHRTLAARRADLEHQIRSRLSDDSTMALTEPEQVRKRMKELRARAGNPSQYEVAHEINVPPRTFQSWENAEVETDRENYERIATFYSKRLKRKVTANWILFGQDAEPPLTTPDLMGSANGTSPEIQSQLDRMETELAEVHEQLTAFIKVFGDRALPAIDALREEAEARKKRSRASRPSGRTKGSRAARS